MKNVKNKNKFIKASNKLINIANITYVYLDDKDRTIRINFNNDVYLDQSSDDTIAEYFFWTISSQEEYDVVSQDVLDLLLENGFVCPNIQGRKNIINISNVSYVKYNTYKKRIIFNFNSSRTIRNNKVNDFAFWELNSADEMNDTITWLETLLDIN